ncbi:DNA-processing protein DprA [Aquimarina agarilytica]|uniref:DNA-processing protein DprA n=1 Tax=Aquimarina agarilytica TaxID=1087449 RepID=UPI0002EF002E|nr:DNA-processing protein DprA [Aquimarina agarilytica]
MTELQALLCLQHVPNLGDASIKKMIQIVGSAEGVLKEKKSNLLKIDGIGEARVASLYDESHVKAAEKELIFVEHNKIKLTSYMDSEYPAHLAQCVDGPIVLFGSGTIDLKNKLVLSIVGTRKITRYGTQFCEDLVAELAPFDPVIVSGFAYGVDITAHKAAVANNLQTVACLAHGLNQIYPKTHKQYMKSMEENGGFFTDFWSTDAFNPQNFLRRNRIIAGLSKATIVIESADKGGSLVTAQIANSYYRDVFAVPGKTTDPYSKGCNMLIKTQQAHMLTSIADLVYILNLKQNEIKAQPPIQKELFVDLDENEQRVYDFLQKEGKQDLDSIALHCNIPTYQLASMLLNLELKGVLNPLPGKLFEVA